MKKIIVAAVCLVAAVAFAGEKRSQPVFIDFTFKYATGSIADARASTDTRQSIGCSVTAQPTTTGMQCTAIDSQGRSAMCYSYNPEFVKAAQSVGPDSWIFFYFDDASLCTYLTVTNASYTRPKTL